MKRLIPIIVVFFLIISCRKEIIDVNSDYEGNWFGTADTSVHTSDSEHAVLNIDLQSHLDYKSYNQMGEIKHEFNGTAKVKNNNLYVRNKGVLLSHHFTIISPPAQINSSQYHWTMKLDGPDGTLPYYR